jgi:hypothetical protein
MIFQIMQKIRSNKVVRGWWLLTSFVLAGLWVGIRPLLADNAVVGTGDPGSCTEGALDTALFTVQNSGGGTITFNCGDAVYMMNLFVGSTGKIISTNVTIDGGNKIILNAYNERRHFYVDSGASLTLQNITLIQGRNNDIGGGAIYNLGALTLDNTTISASNVDILQYTGASGGAILSYGPVTITNSLIDNNTGASAGGLNLDGETAVATITGSTFRDNSTTNVNFGLGGAITTWNGADVTLSTSTLERNVAQYGGAIYNGSITSTIVIEANTEFIINTATFGGGIYNYDGTLTVSNSTLSGNSANFGGGIWSNGTLTVTNSILSSNFAQVGGGIEGSGNVTVSNSTLSANSASGVGGGIYTFGTLTVANSTLLGNLAGSFGGGIEIAYGSATVSSSTLSGNSAQIGGGIYNSKNGKVTVSSSTLSDNSASGVGGGIYTFGNALVSNSIIANSSSGGDCDGVPLTNGEHNLVEDNSCGFTGGSDPKLGSLADNGGPTWTHALLPGSPAIDAGDTTLTSDQRGVHRPQGAADDIGAYELEFSSIIFLPLVLK